MTHTFEDMLEEVRDVAEQVNREDTAREWTDRGTIESTVDVDLPEVVTMKNSVTTLKQMNVAISNAEYEGHCYDQTRGVNEVTDKLVIKLLNKGYTPEDIVMGLAWSMYDVVSNVKDDYWNNRLQRATLSGIHIMYEDKHQSRLLDMQRKLVDDLDNIQNR